MEDIVLHLFAIAAGIAAGIGTVVAYGLAFAALLWLLGVGTRLFERARDRRP